jgi:CubicO group peptidase (beta-lactamase class C family)
MVGGAPVVDLWGGIADPVRGTAWQRDTLSTVFSCTKGAVALCAHRLASLGKLDLDAPIRELWPELAHGEKQDATVRMALDHTLGQPVFREPLEPGGCTRWDYMVGRLEAEPPFWKPGTRHGYHMISFGWTVGELVRRASGRSLGDFFRAEIAEPLGLDFWIGLPEELESRVAPMLLYERTAGEPLNEFARAILADPSSIPALSMTNLLHFRANSREGHAAELGGGGGITNARGLAGMYRPLSLDGDGLVSAAAVARMRRISTATNRDATLLIPTRFAMGFMVSMDNRRVPGADSAVLGEHAFGHVGAGGSIGFADPAQGLAFGYSMNQMGPGILLNERGQSLVDAAYACC